MLVLGVANHSPDFLLVQLNRKYGVGSSDVLVVNNTLPKKTRKKYFLFLSVASFQKSLESVNKQNNCTGFVFGSPLDLCAYTGMFPMDFYVSTDLHIDAFVFKELDFDLLSKDGEHVAIERLDFTQAVSEKIESFTGILTQFMTFIYTLPSATHQKPYKELACRWWGSSDNEEKLAELCSDIKYIAPISEKQEKKFIQLVTSENALIYKAALKVAKVMNSFDSKEFLELTAKYGVSAYEMRYILSVIQSNGENNE